MTMVFGHYLLILIIMFFLHIVEDFHLQGILASMKQKSWWQEHAPDSMYKDDYLSALVSHAFSWSFIITLPWLIIAFITPDAALITCLFISYLCNTFGHALVDTLKANEHILNLCEDQHYHYLQILVTWLILTIAYII